AVYLVGQTGKPCLLPGVSRMNSLPAQSCCPAREDLYRLALNTLPEEEARRLRQHVEECEACREALPDLGQTLCPNPAAFDRDPYVDTGHFDSPDTPAPEAEGPAADAVSGPRFPFLTPPDSPEDLGRLGIYRIVGVLGEGGM